MTPRRTHDRRVADDAVSNPVQLLTLVEWGIWPHATRDSFTTRCVLKVPLALFSTTLIASPGRAVQILETPLQDSAGLGAGWQGFTDFYFMGNALLTLALAAVLGGVIAFHPKNKEAIMTLEGIDSPKIYVIYPVIGALVGIMVVNYGLVVGFVLFGIGGLMRFRTVLRSPSLTGRIIFVTLIGLACGLNLPHVAVLSTAFGFALVYILDAPVMYRLDIRALPPEHITEAIMAYRILIEQQGCQILREKENCGKSRVTFVLKCPRRSSRSRLEKLFKSRVDKSLAGSVIWRVT